MRTAIADDGFVLHYQPQYDLTRSRIIGAEALLRWKHPELGLLAPADFLEIAEETGLMRPARRVDPAHGVRAGVALERARGTAGCACR